VLTRTKKTTIPPESSRNNARELAAYQFLCAGIQRRKTDDGIPEVLRHSRLPPS